MTLRGLFVAVTILAVTCAAFKFAGVWASIFFGVALLVVVAVAIIAFVDRGSRQAFAIGFTLTAMIYVATVLATHTGFGALELDPYSCRLPTTKLLAPAFTLFVQRTWIDFSTGKEVPDYVSPPSSRGGMMGVGSTVGLSEFPDRATFAAVGHVLWTLLLGCIGGYFARWTYARRQANGSPQVMRESQSQ